jgi:hypothetical protein
MRDETRYYDEGTRIRYVGGTMVGCWMLDISGLGEVVVVSKRARTATTLTIVVGLSMYHPDSQKPSAFLSLVQVKGMAYPHGSRVRVKIPTGPGQDVVTRVTRA